MTVESATYIADLAPANPAGGDAKSEGDNHLRLIKDVLQNTFPNLDGAVTPTPAQINAVVGGADTEDTSAIVPAAGWDLVIAKSFQLTPRIFFFTFYLQADGAKGPATAFDIGEIVSPTGTAVAEITQGAAGRTDGVDKGNVTVTPGTGALRVGFENSVTIANDAQLNGSLIVVFE